MAVYDLLIDKVQDSNEGELSVNQLNVWDGSFRIQDTDDTTKELAFNVGGVTTATTRTITVPDYDFTVGGGTGNRVPVISGASNLTLGVDDSGTLIEIDGASQAYVLPTLTGSATNGLVYEFVVTTTSSAVTITAAAGDIMHGGVTIMSTGAGVENDAFSSNGSSNIVFTMNGTTKGGIIGSWVKFWAASATKWVVTGNLIGSGTLVTPFSDS